MWRATRGGHELKHLGLLSALRSANLCVRAKLNRGAVSLGTDASRRATELRSPAPARYWKEKGHHPGGLSRYWRYAASHAQDAAHNPNHRIAIGVIDPAQKPSGIRPNPKAAVSAMPV